MGRTHPVDPFSPVGRWEAPHAVAYCEGKILAAGGGGGGAIERRGGDSPVDGGDWGFEEMGYC